MLWLPLVCWSIAAAQGQSTEYGVPQLNYVNRNDLNERPLPFIPASPLINQGQGTSMDFHDDQNTHTFPQPIQENVPSTQIHQQQQQPFSLPPLPSPPPPPPPPPPSPVISYQPISPLPLAKPREEYGLPPQVQYQKVDTQVNQFAHVGLQDSPVFHQAPLQFVSDIPSQPQIVTQHVDLVAQPERHEPLPVPHYPQKPTHFAVKNYNYRPLQYLPAVKGVVRVNAVQPVITHPQPLVAHSQPLPVPYQAPLVTVENPHRYVVILQKHQAPGRADISTASFLSHSLGQSNHQLTHELPQIPQGFHSDSNSGSSSSTYISKDVNHHEEFNQNQPQPHFVQQTHPQLQQVQQHSGVIQQPNQHSALTGGQAISQAFSRYGVPNA